MLPGVSNAGLWRVCYDAPVIPATLEDGNQSFDALLVELSENPTAPAPSLLLADDAVVDAQATASDAPRRAGRDERFGRQRRPAVQCVGVEEWDVQRQIGVGGVGRKRVEQDAARNFVVGIAELEDSAALQGLASIDEAEHRAGVRG